MSTTIMDRFEQGRLLFDGGMGSMLMTSGLAAGWPPEEFNVSRPDLVKSVHHAYLEAGAEVIETNTFGGTPGRLVAHGFGERVGEFTAAGVRLAREAIAEARAKGSDGPTQFVAMSVGPSTEMLSPVGTADEADVRAEFVAQLEAVADSDTPDIVVVETMLDVREALIALDVSKQALDVPVAVSLTYNRNPRGFFTIMGDDAATATRRLEVAGADVIAANCSISSGDMTSLAKLLREFTSRPLLCQPNAGQPGIRDGVPLYDQSPNEFADHAMQLFDAGVSAVGGCCGTTPEFIRLIAARIGEDR